ncbi:hypothetical protein I4U23_031164 [Adineta vaga]|nr:hypothetical protein I4U23_031164 [Adineta vaga]
MSKHIGLFCIFIALVYLNTILIQVSATTIDHPSQPIESLLDPANIDPDYFIANQQMSYDDDSEAGVDGYRKRSFRKNWAKLFERSQPRYTIAFPALLRSRRWIEEEQ